MTIYNLKRTQILPLTLAEAWTFFSDPRNLAIITPEYMGFKILYISGHGPMYPGQIIRYQVQGIRGITMHWVTEITHVNQPYYFVDEQRSGPYALWHHQHHFREVEGGIEMTDEVNYALPLGPLGTWAHALFVKRSLSRIFDYRFKKLEALFVNKSASAIV
ncbi:MAG: hypothetical protein KatS3mg032_2183 [Cyclobacteriaceae bacterium]|nr:MAG: hypothetical protein KatS3mg032_2183 [Cyclobacteriaceae bacterium]